MIKLDLIESQSFFLWGARQTGKSTLLKERFPNSIRYVQSLASCTYFFLGGFLRRKHRSLLYQLSEHFGFEKGSTRPDHLIPTADLGDIISYPLTPILYELDYVPGNITEVELVVIASIVRRQAPQMCFEIGTFDGRTTMNLAANAGTSAHVLTLDLPVTQAADTRSRFNVDKANPWDRAVSIRRFHSTALNRQIEELCGDSATFDFSPFMNRADFVFIDGEHSFEHVTRDTRTALRLIGPGGGTIVWHDYGTPNWPGVTAALDRLYETEPLLAGIRHIRSTSLCVLEVKR